MGNERRDQVVVPGPDGHDYGAHGRFGDRTHEHSPQVWASQHHGVLGLLAAVALPGTGPGVARAQAS
jgi:hypothetical protein